MKKTGLILLLFSWWLSMVTGCSSPAPSHERELLELYAKADSTIRLKGNYPEALELYLTFISGAEQEAMLDSQLVKAYLWAGLIYATFNDADHAIEYNKLAYSLSRKLGNDYTSELSLTNLAQSYKIKGDYQNASATADSLLVLNVEDRKVLMFHYSITKGEIALQEGRYSEALGHLRRADSIARASGLSSYDRSAPLEQIALYYEKVGIADSQRVYLDKVWNLRKSTDDPQPKAECARMLMEFHVKQGNADSARVFQEEYFRLTDSLVNVKNFMSVNTHHLQMQMASKKNEIDYLNREAHFHKIFIAVVVIFFIMAIVAIIIIIRQKRNLNESYRTLFEKGQRIMEFSPASGAAPSSLVTATEQEHLPADDGNASREDARNRALYDKIVHAMESSGEYLNPDFGLSNIVAMAGSNVAYVTKVVKAYSGQNIPAFINEYRIREACRRILDQEHYGNITFAAIGESVGFNTQVSFNRAFKKVTGLTPSIYQKLAEERRKEG